MKEHLERAYAYTILFGILSCGWFANDAHRYVANLYHEARICEATQCESIKEMAETMGQPPALTKGIKK